MRSMDILPLNVSLGCTYLCIHNPLDGATVTKQRPLVEVGGLIMVLVARIDLVREGRESRLSGNVYTGKARSNERR